jgi:hypothetical protein
MTATVSTIIFDCADAGALGEFYSKATGWEVASADDDFVYLSDGGPIQLAFQRVPGYRPPAWPDPAKQAHLDLKVADVDAAITELVAGRRDPARVPTRRRVGGAHRPGRASVLHQRGHRRILGVADTRLSFVSWPDGDGCGPAGSRGPRRPRAHGRVRRTRQGRRRRPASPAARRRPAGPGRGRCPAAELNSMWTRYAGSPGFHWTGGDRTVSVALPGDRLGWLFSDTFLGAVNLDGSRPADSPFVHNTLVVQTRTGLTETLYGGSPEFPKSLMCDDSVGSGAGSATRPSTAATCASW